MCGHEKGMGKGYNIFKNVIILEIHYFNWNHHEKCIQMSTNMPSIGSVICEIGFEIKEISKGKISFACW